MTPSEAIARVLYTATENSRYSEPPGTDELREVIRRDWAVRVLDAYDLRVTGKVSRWEPFTGGTKIRGEYCPNNGIRYSGNTREEARLAAAQAVWPELSADVRAELGDCP